MTQLPKPAKRGRKPRRPIRRLPPIAEANKRWRDLVKEADGLWRDLARMQPGDLCDRCRMRPWRDCHHLVSRRYFATRWDPENCARLCSGCHMLVTHDGEENRHLAIRMLGLERWQVMNGIKSSRAIDVRLVIVGLKALREMENGKRRTTKPGADR
jgi:hypothetical protein